MSKWYEAICKYESLVIKIVFVFLVGLVFVAAVTRYIGYPINWSVDMAVCLFAWVTFIGGDVAMRNNKLMNVDFFVNKLSGKNKLIVEMINLYIILVFLAALIVFGIWLSYTTRFRTFQGIPGFSYTWVTLSVPVGGFLMAITAITKIREKSKK
jgi:TRAP-type C4-dicarboxylate transport system permease small subunit